MTGESVPVEYGVGDAIIGGTRNLEATIRARVTSIVGDSVLDRIVSLEKTPKRIKLQSLLHRSGFSIPERLGAEILRL